METKHNILVEYSDGSFQWLKNTTSREAMDKPGVKHLRSYCDTRFDVDTKRWRTGKSQFEKILVDC